ncbi:hypothetical protein Ancab_021770 [Ancistrocladus abbreviatus]
MSSTWGTLISLDRATSSKSCLGIARLLISTKVLSAISEKVAASIDSCTFLNNVVEEASGETIFLKGANRTQLVESQQTGARDGNSNSEAGHSYSSGQCSLSASRHRGKPRSSEISSAIEKRTSQKTLDGNDDELSHQNGHSQGFWKRTVGQHSVQSSMMGNSDCRYMSPYLEESVGALVEERSIPLKRREELC